MTVQIPQNIIFYRSRKRGVLKEVKLDFWNSLFVSFVLLSLDDEAPKIVWSGDVVSIRKMSVPLCSEEHKWFDKDLRRQSEKQPFLIVILLLCN